MRVSLTTIEPGVIETVITYNETYYELFWMPNDALDRSPHRRSYMHSLISNFKSTYIVYCPYIPINLYPAVEYAAKLYV